MATRKVNTKYLEIIKSIGVLNNWSLLKYEGPNSNQKLDSLSYEKIRTEVEKRTGLKRMVPPKGDIQEGMPKSGAAWIFTAKIPGSDCTISVFKHEVRKMNGVQLVAFAPAYGVDLSNPDNPISDWRVYNIYGIVSRIKFWLDKLTGIRMYT